MDVSVPLWQTLLGVLGVVVLIGVPVAASLWAQRRRRRGDEATTTNAEGAEAIVSMHGGPTSM